MNRRAFLAQSALAAAALVAAEACGDGQIGPPIPKTVPGEDPTIPGGPSVTANVSQLAVGTVLSLERDRAVLRTGAATFVGLSRICTHQFCTTEVVNNRFECGCHGSIFAADGSVVRGPNVAAPPNKPLTKLATTFNPATNEVTVA